MTISNKKAYYEYNIETKYVAGLVLSGTEIKSLRAGKASFNDSYCFFNRGELFVKSTEPGKGTTFRIILKK